MPGKDTEPVEPGEGDEQDASPPAWRPPTDPEDNPIRRRHRGSYSTRLIGTLTESDLVEVLKSRFGENRRAAEKALDEVLSVIAEELARGEKVTLQGFGTFASQLRYVEHVGQQAGRAIRNVRVPVFRPGAQFIQAVTQVRLPAPPISVSEEMRRVTERRTRIYEIAAQRVLEGAPLAQYSSPASRAPAAAKASSSAKKAAAKKSSSSTKKAAAKKSSSSTKRAAAKKSSSSTKKAAAKKSSSSTKKAAAKKSSSSTKKAAAKKSSSSTKKPSSASGKASRSSSGRR